MSACKCPHCSVEMMVVPQLVGKTVSCPECNGRFTMQATASASPTNHPPPLDAKESHSPIVSSTARERSTRRNSQSNRSRSVSAARIGTLIDLIDFQFRSFVTPIIVKFVYLVYILNVVSGFFGLIYMVVAGPLAVMTDSDLSTQEKAGGIIGGFGVVVCIFIFYTVFSLAGLLAVRLVSQRYC